MKTKLFLCLALVLAGILVAACGQGENRQANKKANKNMQVNKHTKATISFIGDILLAGRVERQIKRFGVTFPLAKVKDEFAKADLVVGNLECPLSSRGIPVQGKTFTFRAAPESIRALVDAGVGLAFLANNHTMDYGIEALLDTLQILKDNKIAQVGAGENLQEARKPYIIKINGQRIGFLGYSNMLPMDFYARSEKPGTNPAYQENIKEDIKKLKENTDFIVAIFHWGDELSNKPAKYEKYLAHLTIDAGADLIIAHHPHVLQGLEVYKGKVIAYSLGNFVFNGTTEPTQQSIILDAVIDKGRLKKLIVKPVYIVDTQPALADEIMASKILGNLDTLSGMLGTHLVIKGKKAELEVN